MVGPFLPPQGLPSSGGSGPEPQTVGFSGLESSTTTGTFTANGANGSQASSSGYYTLDATINVPDAATAILSVEWHYEDDYGWATPQGYVDGVTSAAVALLSHTSGSLATFTLSGDLALSTTALTVPVTYANEYYTGAITYIT